MNLNKAFENRFELNLTVAKSNTTQSFSTCGRIGVRPPTNAAGSKVPIAQKPQRELQGGAFGFVSVKFHLSDDLDEVIRLEVIVMDVPEGQAIVDSNYPDSGSPSLCENLVIDVGEILKADLATRLKSPPLDRPPLE